MPASADVWPAAASRDASTVDRLVARGVRPHDQPAVQVVDQWLRSYAESGDRWPVRDDELN